LWEKSSDFAALGELTRIIIVAVRKKEAEKKGWGVFN
jgi:hypothetical protein